jgi:hypothetical protein
MEASWFKNSNNWMMIIVISILGVEVFPMLPGDQSSAENDRVEILKKLEEYERTERDAKIEANVLNQMEKTLSAAITNAVGPLLEKMDRWDRERRVGSRWYLEDEIAKWEADGKKGVDPRKIQADRLAAEALKDIEKEKEYYRNKELSTSQ